MPIVNYSAYFARKKREGIAHALTHSHRCGICGAALTDPYAPDLCEIVARCSRDRTHRGMDYRQVEVISDLDMATMQVKEVRKDTGEIISNRAAIPSDMQQPLIGESEEAK